MLEHKVNIPGSTASSYGIKIGAQILSSLFSQINEDYSKYNKFIITDENLVSSGHLQSFIGDTNLPAYIIRPAGEKSKHINTVISIIESMEKECLGRDTLVLALGGGTVGDIAGFAASIFKRGVPVIQIPTTTLAMADSAVGGKTGVDSSVSKNAFGAFWHPAAVYIDVETLTTLEERQYRAGLVESVKHAIIVDSEYFDFLEKNINLILQRNFEVLEQIALKNCRIKGKVVEEDPYEKNKRSILNYGHTIGHAVESASNYTLLHGEAIAIGIIAAGLIEIEKKLAEPERFIKIREILKKLNMPVKLPDDISEKALMDLLKHDKKAVNKWPGFVLVNDIGQVHTQNGRYTTEVEPELVEEILKKL